MDDTIYRQEAIDAIYEEFSCIYCHNCEKELNEDLCEDCHRKYMGWSASKQTIEKVINSLPSAQRERGKWIPQDMNKSYGMISTAVYYYPKCSVCGQSANYTNFCPNCGAKMEED